MKKEEWTLDIKPQVGWFELHLDDLWRYRDLIILFVRRDFVSQYKQTILGPLWVLIQPLLTTIMFMLVFAKVARIPTDGIPPSVFYMSGLTIWNFFSTSLNKTSTTFITNASIFGKVYFPRLVMPISNVISSLISFGIQFCLLLAVIVYYILIGTSFHPNVYLFLVPLILVLMAALSLGLGIIISALTTKYRDLSFLISFSIQLLMYATPVIFPLSYISTKYKWIILANPLSPLIETFRFALLGSGTFDISHLMYSVIFTFITLLVGIIMFNQVEKSFMDVV